MGRYSLIHPCLGYHRHGGLSEARMIAGLIVGWLICALVARRLFYIAFRRLSSDPASEGDDQRGAAWMAAGGPFSLLIALVLARDTK